MYILLHIDYCDCSFPSALDFKSLPRCPQESGMGACMFPAAGKDRGEAWGYLLSDITEEVTGVLKLSYFNGAKCSKSGKNHVVHIFFQCEKGVGVVSDVNIFTVFMHTLYMLLYIHVHVQVFICVHVLSVSVCTVHFTCTVAYLYIYISTAMLSQVSIITVPFKVCFWHMVCTT